MKRILSIILASSIVLAAGCTEPGGEEPAAQGDEFGIVVEEAKEGEKATFDATGDEELVIGKADAITGRKGLPVSIDNEATSVWEVSNQWEDRNPAAGIAWGENSGLTWEQKYERWVESLDRTDAHGSSRETFTLTTPWGKSLPAPALECAEVAIFLRVTFASWYKLPFFLEAADRDGRIYFGHFGMRREEGRFSRTPDFRTRYEDFSSLASSVIDGGEWPSDSSLRNKKIPGSFDDAQPALGEDLHAGAYFDEIYLNKRVGHFLITTLAYFGSIHLADSRNTFNLKPEGIDSGDVLVERWQSTGIGHVLVIMEVDEAGVVDGEEKLEVEVASGSMPRRQPVWESSGASKRYFRLDYTGGPGYGQYGGGAKRWRIAKPIDGHWTNVVSEQSRDVWINSRSTDEIEARTQQFADLLIELSPEQKRDVLLDVIESKREHLRRYPASCAARIAREDAFDLLYTLMQDEYDLSPSEVDEQYRLLEDYVFAELDYSSSKTCCWNSSTGQMFDIAMEMNIELQESAMMCADVVVFMNRDDDGDGFQLFRDYAVSTDRGDQWVDWRADESCPQSGVAADTFAERQPTNFCELGLENDVPVTGDVSVFNFTERPVAIPDNDTDGVTLTLDVVEDGALGEVVLDLAITHTYRGDLEIELVHPGGERAMIKERGWDSSDDVVDFFSVTAFDGLDRKGTWTLHVRDLANLDTGEVVKAKLELR